MAPFKIITKTPHYLSSKHSFDPEGSCVCPLPYPWIVIHTCMCGNSTGQNAWICAVCRDDTRKDNHTKCFCSPLDVWFDIIDYFLELVCEVRVLFLYVEYPALSGWMIQDIQEVRHGHPPFLRHDELSIRDGVSVTIGRHCHRDITSSNPFSVKWTSILYM